MKKNELVLFETQDSAIRLEVPMQDETVWLSLNQMAELFNRDKSTISRHIKNALAEELSDVVVVAKFATTTEHGAIEGKTQTHMTEYYNLDMIISVGYRVKSQRGVEFRKWANGVLRDYIIRGHAVNDNRMKQLGEVIRVIKRAEDTLDAKQVLSVIERYNMALDMLDDYDHQTLAKPKGNHAIYNLTYEECRKIIDEMKFRDESTLFGNEKDGSFKGSIGAIYQSFDGKDLYPTLEEKAANLLYFVVKNHSFSDGNKRIAAAMFIYFLDRNKALFIEGKKTIADYTLVTLTIMIAESNPEEKETMIKVIMNCMIHTQA